MNGAGELINNVPIQLRASGASCVPDEIRWVAGIPFAGVKPTIDNHLDCGAFNPTKAQNSNAFAWRATAGPHFDETNPKFEQTLRKEGLAKSLVSHCVPAPPVAVSNCCCGLILCWLIALSPRLTRRFPPAWWSL